MSEQQQEKPKMGRPKKIVAKPLGYAKQVRINGMLHDYYVATECQDGPGAQELLDELVALLETAIE